MMNHKVLLREIGESEVWVWAIFCDAITIVYSSVDLLVATFGPIHTKRLR